MKLYMATIQEFLPRLPAESDYRALGLTPRILLSYWYGRRPSWPAALAARFPAAWPDMVADSGAFSAKNAGAPVTLDGYADWLERHHGRFTWAANLDVMGDHVASRANFEELTARGHRVVPVFHVGSPTAELERLVEAHPLVALGAMIPHIHAHRRHLHDWLLHCFRVAEGRAVYHGLGLTTWELIRDLPWYSCDSSTWKSGVRFGRVSLFDPDRGRFVIVRFRDYRAVLEHGELIRSYGRDPEAFLDRARLGVDGLGDDNPWNVSALGMARAEAWLTATHGPVAIPRRNAAPCPPPNDPAPTGPCPSTAG